MRIAFVLTTFLAFISLSNAQTFPKLTGETADGKTVKLPHIDKKPYTVIGLAYGKKASPIMEAWYEPIYLRFVSKHGMFASMYECDAYFVPLFVGGNQAAYAPSMKQFAKSAEPDVVQHVLFSKEDIAPLNAALDISNPDIPYFFVLDAQGKILYRTQGEFTDDKLEAMEDVMLD